jgi:ABC-2 type transport system ATP-binding protein
VQVGSNGQGGARPAIELRGVTRRFGSLTAVDAVSLDVHEGEIVGLLGHNGAGKTTLIRVINGLLSPDGGQVLVRGMDPVTDGRDVRRMTGVLTEYPALDEYLTARENLEVYAAINGIRADLAAARIDELLLRLGLWEKRDEPARGLSAGLKQRVALARGMVHDPTLLLLDEPTTNMDPVAARDVRELIVESVREHGHTVLLSTHNLQEAEAICDRVAIMRNGRLLLAGAPAELRRQLGGAFAVRVTTTHQRAAALAEHLAGRGPVTRVNAATVETVPQRDIPTLVEELVAQGFPIEAVQPLEPTLEDLYVALHGTEPAPAPDSDEAFA